MLKKQNETTVSGVSPYEELTGVYTIDPVHSMIGFSVRRAVISDVRGIFDSFGGLLKLNGSQSAWSEAHVSVQTESLDTGITDRDARLKGPDYFDSSTFPLMTFRSTKIVPVGDDEFRLVGNLKIKDIGLPIEIDIEIGGAGRDAYGLNRVGFEGRATLKRSDWGLTWNTALETGGVFVSDKVTLILDISAVQVNQAAAA
ncbi:YceI family protein [Streptomyces sp. NPDC102274]|uniref:YceI family protein n=1 Tax=Streptomyces sp. NPDC102274 TaxID=3366151 RepID=UPI00380FAB38